MGSSRNEIVAIGRNWGQVWEAAPSNDRRSVGGDEMKSLGI